MKKAILSSTFLLLTLCTACSQQVSFNQRIKKLGLQFVKDVPLSGGPHRFDYQSINESQRQLYIAHMGSNLLTVYAIDEEKIIKDKPNMPNIHGVLAVPKLHRVFASVTGKDEVAVIDENTLAVIANIPVGDYPDGLAYAPVSKRVFISDEHGKTVSVIDAVHNQLIQKIAIGGEVGNTHYDAASGLIYSADQTNNQLVVIAPDKLTIIARYNLPGCEGAHGFYIDPTTHQALITGEDNASLVVFDLKSKKITATFTVGRGPDVLDFDKGKHLLFVSSESGTVSVFQVEADGVEKKGEAYFYKGAHTVSVDSKTHQAFFPLPNVEGKPVLRIVKIM